MRTLTLMAALFAALSVLSWQAQAGTVKLTWNEDMTHATDNTAIQVDRFRLYWAKGDTDPLTNLIALGPPPPASSGTSGALTSFTQTLSNPLWLPGEKICFRMTAAILQAGNLVESESTPLPTAPRLCKVMETTPPKAPQTLVAE